ncbi:hypothetical protein AB0H20_28860 [Nocardia fluminea]
MREIIHTLPHATQVAVRESLDSSDDTPPIEFGRAWTSSGAE